MKIPPYLCPGDTIGFVSVAGYIEKEIAMPGIKFLESLGYKTVIAEHAFGHFYQYAATDEQRRSDLQAMLDNPEIKAIVCTRGGYGSLRAIEKIDWTFFCSAPKWIVGFSDITVLHSAAHNLGIGSIHGTMPRFFLEEGKPTESFNTLVNSLHGNSIQYNFDGHNLNRRGMAEGQLIGGNLSMLYSLRATPYDLDTRGKILFIEDLGEYLYHLDRMMMNLKASGFLKNLVGLIVGSFTGMKDNDTPFGMTVEEIISDVTKEYGFPVAFNFPAGHQKENFALKLGSKVILSVGETSQLNFE